MLSAVVSAAAALKYSSPLSALDSALSLLFRTAHTSFSCGCCLAAVAAPLLRLLWVCAMGLRMFPRARLHMVLPTFYEEISHAFVTWAVERNPLLKNTAFSKKP